MCWSTTSTWIRTCLGGGVFDRAVIAPDLDDEDLGYYQGTPFSGRFDGQGFQIRHLLIEGQDFLGLFGSCTAQAVLTNLTMELGEVRGWRSIGGLVGENHGQIIACDCYAIAQGEFYVGGLVGRNAEGMLAACHSGSTVNGRSWVGGLVGHNDCGIIHTSTNTGRIRALVPAEDPSVDDGDQSQPFPSFDSDRDYVGGLVGRNTQGHVVSSYSTGDIEGKERVGGLVGDNDGYIWTSCSTGTVDGLKYVGGVVGDNSGTVTSCYSTGKVSGQEAHYIGGVAGSGGDHNVFASFWDTQSSGMPTSNGGTGLTTAEMKDPETYLRAGWDFAGETDNGTSDYWFIEEGEYPRLHAFTDAVPAPTGSGTREDPYRITDALDLGSIWHRPLACYQLDSDIDLGGITWAMAVVPGFGGIFDGRQFRIRALCIEGGDALGLFGNLTAEAEVRNVDMFEVDIRGIDTAAGLAGTNAGLISNSRATGTVLCPKRGFHGGLVGVNTGRMEQCDSSVSVTGNVSVGGLAAANSGVLWNCTSSGPVTGRSSVGGLVGSNSGWLEDAEALIRSCSSIGTVQGMSDVGGLVGRNTEGTILYCRSQGDVQGKSGYIGGLVGSNNMGVISCCYTLRLVSGRLGVGGLVANNDGRVEDSYSTGEVSGEFDTGGLIGIESPSGTVTASFWDLEASGRVFSAAGIGLDTKTMKHIDTFLEAGWDFIGEDENGTEDIWWIDEGKDYPRLWWELEEEAPE